MTIEPGAEAPSTEETPQVDTTISEEESLTTSSEDSADRENREESRFKEGQILRFVRVRFPGNSRSFSFLVGKRTIEYGQKVVAMSDRGMAVGYVNSFPYDLPFNKSMLPIRSISKIASDDDITTDKEAYRRQKDAENICNALIEDYKLDMHLTHVEFTSFGKKAVFYFIAPARVDFRDLVRDLVGKLKTRIELRQISVRDRSAAIGGIGPCGRELCCSSFLTKYGNVGIKMAKNQDLTLNFSKLNGVCGQLKCCLQYEDDVYREKRSRLPKEGDFIATHTGEFGRVDRLHLLSEQFVMMTNRGIRKRYVVDLYKETVTKDEAKFPNEFESVSDETHKIIGMDDAEARKVKEFEQEIKTYENKSKVYADSIFESLFGEKTLDYSLPELTEPESNKSAKVKVPDDEEEISYTPDEDEILPEDDESVVALKEEANYRPRTDFSRSERPSRDERPRDDRPRDHQQNRQRPQGDRPRNQQQGQGQANRGPRDDRPRNPNQQQSQNRGPRPEGPRNDNRGQQGQGQRSNQGQGRNRPPR